MFSVPIRVHCYIPNKRLRDLNSEILPDSKKYRDTSLVAKLGSFIITNFRSPKNFLPGGSSTEKTITDNYLQQTLHEMSRLYVEEMPQKRCYVVEKYTPSKVWLCKSIDPEPVVLFQYDGTHLVVLGSEAKGIEASNEKAYGQVFLLLANSALHLYHLGVPLEQCVVLGVTFSGEGFRFVAVYLIADCWPVFVILSPSLHPLEDYLSIATWFAYSFEFAENTALLLA